MSELVQIGYQTEEDAKTFRDRMVDGDDYIVVELREDLFSNTPPLGYFLRKLEDLT